MAFPFPPGRPAGPPAPPVGMVPQLPHPGPQPLKAVQTAILSLQQAIREEPEPADVRRLQEALAIVTAVDIKNKTEEKEGH